MSNSDSSSTTKNKVVFHESNSSIVIDTVHLRHEMTISNFSSLLKLSMPKSCIRSDIFIDPNIPKVCWEIFLYPGKEKNCNIIFFGLNMSTLIPVEELTLRACCRFSFIKDNGECQYSTECIKDFHLIAPYFIQIGCIKTMSRLTVEECIRNDNSLFLVCEIEYIPNQERFFSSVTFKNSLQKKDITTSDVNYISRISEMYELKRLTDFKIICDDHQFLVHKFILATHSPVFRAMFCHNNTNEVKDNCLTIIDSNPFIVEKMIKYMYYLEINNTLNVDEGLGLLHLAEKYDIISLKNLCEKELLTKISNDNVCMILQNADIYNANILKDICIKMISQSFKKVMKTKEWDQLKNTHPAVIDEILYYITSSC
ncbi:Speckle-type POZ protein [Strongyloides ratti]|uniref:Speckle-type POZ protein n=1 Tax=Strongyloides ratti TaxID=34506 RepID=A0A090L417_STRRB|nr:Speckle-type POZ protein [Strongyloides ratti]CEF62852.1 Speckle-type POZ protein [Strongyloides ratti]